MKENTHTLPVQKDGAFCYNIILRPDFSELGEQVRTLGVAGRRLCIVADEKAGRLYGEEVQRELRRVTDTVDLYTIPSGEEYKTLDTVRKVYTCLIEKHYDRKDMLVALGGGVTGDLTGFTAATYLRGIGFIQIPTTLLSQVDSSIGGKTGVDFDSYKNMVGAFHMPRLVYINPAVLKTLPERQFASGMGEILKHGLIKNGEYFRWLLENQRAICGHEMEVLLPMIEESCKIKRAVVEQDPTEQGERALLNFGHTVGHAVEKLKDFSLSHGECVAIGTAAAAYLSWKRGLISEKDLVYVCEGLRKFGLPIRTNNLAAEAVLKTTKSDKKMDGGSIRFVLLRHIGEAFVDQTLTEEELLEAIHWILGE